MSKKRNRITGVCRYSDGGATPPSEPAPTEPAATVPTQPQPTAAVQPETDNAKPTQETAKAYSDADLEAARKQAVEDYKQHLKEAPDYNKMTPEEKVAHLEKQIAQEKLTRYTAGALAKAGMDGTLAQYIKGSDEQETDTRVQAFKSAFDTVVQAGVEARFKAIGYTPRLGGVGTPETTRDKKPRGVSVG